MNEAQKLKLLKSQIAPWVSAMGLVAVVLVFNRATENPPLIVGPITIMLLLGCFFFARGSLVKCIDDVSQTDDSPNQ